MRVLGLIAIAASLLAAGGAAAQRFDAVCTGQTSYANGTSEPWTGRLSIDLTAMRWCETAACHPAQIVSVGESSIVLMDSTIQSKLLITSTDQYVSHDKRDGARAARNDAGACIREPFTPFPAAGF
jgi:hypothetical protein